MPVPPPTDEFHPMMIATLTKLVTAVAGVVIMLVGVLYTLLRQTDSKQQDQLDEGADEFTNNALEIERLKKDIVSVREWVKTIEEELDVFELRRMQDHESMILIKDHHKRNHGEEIR